MTKPHRKTLGLIHTSATLVPIFQALCDDKLSYADVFHIADDSLIKDVIRRGTLTATTSRRVVNHIASAQTAGADFILVTCSSIGPAVEAAIPLMDVPVLRVDQPMVDQAVQMAARIGVLATLSTTLEPTTDLVRRRAAVAHREIEITSRLCDGAFDALMSGDAATHDQLVAAGLTWLAQRVDVVLLAQASMARVADQQPLGAVSTPVLASPELAVDHLASLW